MTSHIELQNLDHEIDQNPATIVISQRDRAVAQTLLSRANERGYKLEQFSTSVHAITEGHTVRWTRQVITYHFVLTHHSKVYVP